MSFFFLGTEYATEQELHEARLARRRELYALNINQNRDRVRLYTRMRYYRHAEKLNAKRKEWHEANRERDIETSRRWRENNMAYNRQQARIRKAKNTLKKKIIAGLVTPIQSVQKKLKATKKEQEACDNFFLLTNAVAIIKKHTK
jgi:hypothetical protein